MKSYKITISGPEGCMTIEPKDGEALAFLKAIHEIMPQKAPDCSVRQRWSEMLRERKNDASGSNIMPGIRYPAFVKAEDGTRVLPL